MSAPEVSKIKPLVRRDGEPAFEALGAELQRASARGEPDNQDTYYGAALSALERLIERDGRINMEVLAGRTEQWRRAYLHTPHGKPVALSAGANDTSAPP